VCSVTSGAVPERTVGRRARSQVADVISGRLRVRQPRWRFVTSEIRKEEFVMARNIKIDSAADVVAFLKSQHEEIKGLFTQVSAARGQERKQIFADLRRLLAIHETAEEEIVHPRAKSELDDGDMIVSARLQEEREAKEVLTQLEKLDVDSSQFEEKFSAFRQDVIAHAEAEEREEFSRLAAGLDERQLHRMRKAVELAEKTAPTHPHAGVESRAANLAVGPFAAMLDRAKDLISRS
jgi:hemerythrin superfamily protein